MHRYELKTMMPCRLAHGREKPCYFYPDKDLHPIPNYCDDACARSECIECGKAAVMKVLAEEIEQHKIQLTVF